jgi:hypothetical protein
MPWYAVQSNNEKITREISYHVIKRTSGWLNYCSLEELGNYNQLVP